MMPVWSQNHISNQTFAALISSLRVLQRVWKPKKPKQWTAFQERLPSPPHPHPETQKPHGEHRCFPIHFTRTTLPKRPGVTVSTAHWTHWRCPEGKIRHELAVYLPLSSRIEQHGVILCLRRVIGVFSPEGAWRHTETSQEQQLHYRGGIIWLQTPLLHCESESESNDGMTTALFSLLVQDDLLCVWSYCASFFHKVILII